VIGRLEHDATVDRWYVRYGPAKVNDPDGGVLELVGARPAAGLVAGAVVRVEGQRIGAASGGTSAAYIISTIRPATAGAAK
jgi:hypothetical protein